MKNIEIAKIFYDMADIMEMQSIEWKPQAYRKAAGIIETLSDDLEDVYKGGGQKALEKIPGIGEGISKKIIEFLQTGKIQAYEKLKKSVPSGVEEMMNVPGMGPKKAWKLYKTLGIDSIKKLEYYAKRGRIRSLEGFGEKSEKDILDGLELVKKGQERMLLGRALPIAVEVAGRLSKLSYVKKADIAGSLRRRKETIGDIDILVISDKPIRVMDYFTAMDNVQHVAAKGNTKSSVTLKEGLGCDVRVLNEKQYGAALMYFTGSKDHNIELRKLAIKKGMKLSEYGLFKGSKNLASKTEEEMYRKLNLSYIEPEMRENKGEIGLAKKGKLPKLIPYGSVKGDLQMHSKWSDGSNSIEDMIKTAIKTGYSYIAITDHSKSQRIANGLDEKRLEKYIEEIRKLNEKYKKIEVLAGAEVEISSEGRLDYENDVLKKLDIVIAAIHSGFKASREKTTKRILSALENRYVNMLAHPTGRLITERKPYDFDFDKVVQKAIDNNILLEINAQPNRLDLNGDHVKRCVERGAKMVINTDAHYTGQLKFIELGVAQARRGWAEKKDIVNTGPLKQVRKFLNE